MAVSIQLSEPSRRYRGEDMGIWEGKERSQSKPNITGYYLLLNHPHETVSQLKHGDCRSLESKQRALAGRKEVGEHAQKHCSQTLHLKSTPKLNASRESVKRRWTEEELLHPSLVLLSSISCLRMKRG
jgi:hypothetical protein